VPVDPDSLPHDPAILKQMLVDLTTQLDKTQRLLTQLLAAKSGTRSEQLSADQLRLFRAGNSAPSRPQRQRRTIPNKTTISRQVRQWRSNQARRADGGRCPRI